MPVPAHAFSDGHGYFERCIRNAEQTDCFGSAWLRLFLLVMMPALPMETAAGYNYNKVQEIRFLL